MGTSISIGSPSQFAAFEAECRAAMERAALRATSRAARAALQEVRSQMRAAGLGRLGNAIGTGSDLQKSGTGKHRGDKWSASGWVHVRGRSKRTLGALEAYTESASIRPRRGRYLWIASPQLQRTVGRGSERRRLTPQTWREQGLESRIGKLEFLPARRGKEALLIVKDISVDVFGRGGATRGPRRLPKRGALGGTRKRVAFFVAFVGIRATSRSARVDPSTIFAAHAARLPDLLAEELAKEVS